MTPLAGDLGTAGLAMLERYAGPRELAATGAAELTRLIATASNQQQGEARAREWQAAAAAALELYGDHPAVAFEELAAEVATEVRLLKAVQAELAAHAAAREKRYKKAGPRPARPVAARVRADQRPGPGRGHGPARPVPRRRAVQVLRRARPPGQPDRRD